MEKLLLLTVSNGEKILLGVENIIECVPCPMASGNVLTKIKSVGAMVETNYVIETVEEIHALYKG